MVNSILSIGTEIKWAVSDFIKQYWIELLVFCGISAVMFICCSPDYTWINTDSDGPHYTYSAQYLYPSHKSSAPPFLLLGWLFLKIPFGTDVWRMALISVISGIVASVFIYLIIKKLLVNVKGSRLYGLTGAIVYGGSALPLSQNIIVETYPMIVMLCLGAFYFALCKRWVVVSLFSGLACATHPIALMTIGPMLIGFKELRKWKYLGIMSLFVLFYLYIPLTNREPYMWNSPNSKGLATFINDTFLTAKMLSGGLSIWDLPKRIIDAGLQLVVCFGVGSIALIILYWRTKWYKNLLAWLIIIPIVYYVTDLAPQTNVYLIQAIAFGSVGIGLGLSKIKLSNVNVNLKEGLIVLTASVAVVIMLFNANYFDIGRTLDKNLSATKFYNEELVKIPDGEYFLAQQGWEWAMTFVYNANEGRNIIPISIGTLPDKIYRELWVDKYGIKYEIPETDNTLKYISDTSQHIALSIIKNNDNVWTTQATDPSTYGAEVIKATGNMVVADKVARAIDVLDSRRPTKWAWVPSNPYDIITGSIEVEEWQYITFSNYNCLMFGMLGVIGGIPVWLVWQVFVKKKKWGFSKVKDNIRKVV